MTISAGSNMAASEAHARATMMPMLLTRAGGVRRSAPTELIGFDADAATADGVARTRAQLCDIKNLTPGDFATVKRQAIMLDEQLEAEGILETGSFW